MRAFLRSHRVQTPITLELPEVPARAAAEARMGGFGVATSGPSWRDAKPHWRLVDASTFLRHEPAQIASETFAFDAQLVVTGVGRGEQLRAIRSAGGDLVCGPAFGRPQVRPDTSAVPLVPAIAVSEARESLSFGRCYEPEGALSA